MGNTRTQPDPGGKSATVTYTGRADRYYIKDAEGKRIYFPRGVAVQVPDAVAASLKGRSDMEIGTAAPAEREVGNDA